MYWQNIVYIIVVFIAATITASLAVYACRHHKTPVTKAFVVIMALITLWALGIGLRSLSHTPGVALFWHKFISIGYANIPVAFLAFVLYYIGQRRWLTRRRLAMLLILPLISQIVIWTNDMHGLYIQKVSFFQVNVLTIVEQQIFGPWYWINTIYGYLLLLIGFVLIVFTIIYGSYLYRSQAIVLLVGTFPPLVLNVLHAFYIVPPKLSLTPIGFTFMGLVFAWTIFRHQFLDLAPIARSTLVDIMRDGMLAVDAQGRIVDLNPVMQSILNIRSNTIIGQPAADVLRSWRDLVEHVQGEIREQSEIRLEKEGTVRYYDVRSSLLTGQGGHLTGRLLALHDVTERKQAEAALLTAHNELKKKNEQLREVNASKDKFFSIISHDLRSSFTTLLGYTQLILENFEMYPQKRLKQQVERIHSSAERLYALLENLLTWSRIQRGVIKYDPKETNIQDIITDNITLFTEKAQKKRVYLTTSLQRKIHAYADYNMVNTILRNLISNALKFTETGDTVEISAQEYGSYIEIRVSDTGIGISQEDLPKLFRIDVHYTNTGTAGEIGTGLGLILCKELVEKNGGTIGVESEIGKGTVFKFTLPQKLSKL